MRGDQPHRPPLRLGQAGPGGGRGWLCACCPGASSLGEGRAHTPVMPRSAGPSGPPATQVVLLQGQGLTNGRRRYLRLRLKAPPPPGTCPSGPPPRPEGLVSSTSCRPDSAAQGTRQQAGVAGVNLRRLAATLAARGSALPRRWPSELGAVHSWGPAGPWPRGTSRTPDTGAPLGGALRDSVATLCLLSDPSRTGLHHTLCPKACGAGVPVSGADAARRAGPAGPRPGEDAQGTPRPVPSKCWCRETQAPPARTRRGPGSPTAVTAQHLTPSGRAGGPREGPPARQARPSTGAASAALPFPPPGPAAAAFSGAGRGSPRSGDASQGPT